MTEVTTHDTAILLKFPCAIQDGLHVKATCSTDPLNEANF